MNVKLVVIQGKPEGQEIPLRTPKFLIGRGPECHLRPNSEIAIDAVPAAAAAAQPELASTTSEPAAVSIASAKVAKLGRKDAKDSEIEQWLMSGGSHELPESGSGVFSGDTEMLLRTTIDRAEGKATKTDLETPPLNAQPPKEPTNKVVETESGAKIKISAAKHKIEKTREDTSRAAADILRRMMHRRHDQ